MDVSLAMEAFRSCQKSEMVLKLMELEGIEERYLLAGDLLVILGGHNDKAKVNFKANLLFLNHLLGILFSEFSAMQSH